MNAILKTEDLRMTYRIGKVDVNALRGVNLAVPPGEFISIMGPSGCGKSTLLHILGGLLQPSAGRVLLGDQDMYFFREGTHQRLWEVLGARLKTLDGVAGCQFSVWAPNAQRVSVVGDWNRWDGRMHPMRNRIEAALGITVSATLLWTYPTVAALAEHLRVALGAGAAAPPPTSVDDAAALIDQEFEALG